MSDAWRLLQAGEIVRANDEADMCADGWRDDSRWQKVTEKMVGCVASDPCYPSHQIYRRRVAAGGEVSNGS